MISMYIAVDESGNLGFSAKSTKFFVASFCATRSPFQVRKDMARLLKKLHEKRRYSYNEFKFSRANDFVRREVLKKIANMDLDAGFIVLEKEKVKVSLRGNLSRLYNYVVVNYIMPYVLSYVDLVGKVVIVVDRSLSKSSREAFDNYAANKASWVWSVEMNKKIPIKSGTITIHHVDSEREPCLQVADFLAGSCFQKYENNDERYYEMIKDKVKHFRYLW